MSAVDESVGTGKPGEGRRMSRLFVGMCVLYVTCLLMSNLIAGKLISVCGLVLPAAVMLFPLTYIFGDVFTEVYGFRNARFVIWTGFFCSFLAVVVYLVTVWLPHPDFWTGQEAYRTVFSTTPRVFVASLVAYLAGEFSNAIVLSRLKVVMNGRRLWVRTILSTVVGEGLDTVLFICIAFAGAVPMPVLPQMVLVQYGWKIAYEVLLTPVTCRVIRALKRREGLDVYDRGIRYGFV